MILARKLLRRPAGVSFETELGPETPADVILGRLLDRDELIDRFDATYLDDLPPILREVHDVTDSNARDHALWPELKALWECGNRPLDAFAIADLKAVLVGGAGVNEARWTPKHAPADEQRRQRYVKADSFRKAARTRLTGAADRVAAVTAINDLQRDYSAEVNNGKTEIAFTELARPETGDPWSPLIIKLRENGTLDTAEPHLTIGPRWAGEIHYFRDVLGLPETIGLDLFTNDPELVTVGDMHAMPFQDSTFGLVYQRNTFDKSYDIRKALRECVRVLRPGGVLITDDCYAYVYGVSQLSRTSLKHNRQVLRVLGANAGEVLFDQAPDSREDWIERVGQLAVTIRK